MVFEFRVQRPLSEASTEELSRRLWKDVRRKVVEWVYENDLHPGSRSSKAFDLDRQQKKRIAEWKDRLHREKSSSGGAVGRFTYSFTPTSLGVVVKVHDAVTGRSLDVSEYESW